MQRNPLVVLLVFALNLSFNQAFAAHSEQKVVAGWIENIILATGQIRLRAKLDTGAKTSSIHARHIEEFERDGELWVRFTLPKGLEKKAKAHTLEVPVVRTVLIKRHKLKSAKRFVVELGFCINRHYYETEFTLADRSNYIYPVLLGRRFLTDNIVVDPAHTYLYSKIMKGMECTPELAQFGQLE
ncbi:MAG: ATP-dependent zinc protease [Methylomicrobium sp.]